MYEEKILIKSEPEKLDVNPHRSCLNQVWKTCADESVLKTSLRTFQYKQLMLTSPIEKCIAYSVAVAVTIFSLRVYYLTWFGFT